MRNLFYLLFVSVLIFYSCEETDNSKSVKSEILVKVYNAKTWVALSDKMDTVSGAKVYLIYETGSDSAITNDKGIATFSDVKISNYYITASKGDLSNLLNKTTLNGKVFGNLIIGVYKTQSEANVFQAAVGDLKFLDAVADNIINVNDKVQGKNLSFVEKYKDINGDMIINDNDKVNGSYVTIDNIASLDVYIGK
jgi:hypothetical protein